MSRLVNVCTWLVILYDFYIYTYERDISRGTVVPLDMSFLVDSTLFYFIVYSIITCQMIQGNSPQSEL